MEALENKLAWAAGFFDGEGCIKVVKQKVNYGYGHSHTLALHITQKNIKPLKIFEKIFGGKIYKTKEKRYKDYYIYEWQVHNQNAIRVLKLIRPYLILKLDECDETLKYEKFLASKGFKRLNRETFNKREELYIKLRELKDTKYNRWGVKSLHGKAN